MDNYTRTTIKQIANLLYQLSTYGEGVDAVANNQRLKFSVAQTPQHDKRINFSVASDKKPNYEQIPKELEKFMKYIYKRNDGRWCGRRVIDGKRMYVYGHTQLECAEKLRSTCKNPRQVRKNSEKNQSLITFALWWLDTYKKGNVTENTYKNYKYVINKHLSIRTPLSKLEVAKLQSLINNLPATRVREEVYKLLKMMLKKAYQLDFIKKDFSEFLVKGKITRKERKALSVEEQKLIIDNLTDNMFSNRVRFYLCTGARPSEIATINKNEIKDNWLKINGTKTKDAVRWVKSSNKLLNMLKNQSKEFFNFDNKRFRERLQDFCTNLGIENEVTVYTLRHTFATNLYILKVPEKDRQVYMGHSRGSRMTNDVYTTFSPDTKPKDIYDIYGDYYPIF